MSVINTNYLALVSQNNLTKSQNALGSAIERLSSGLRINSAKDDAAGQAIANRFTANIKGLTQASRNANDGISIAQTTEGALNEINNNLQRIRELTVQAANGSNSESDLDSIQAEITQRLQEIDRVSQQTQFNGVHVLAKDTTLKVQVGANDGQTIGVGLKKIDSATLGLGRLDVSSMVSSKDLSKALTEVGANVDAVTNTLTYVTANASDYELAIGDDNKLYASNDGTNYFAAEYDSTDNTVTVSTTAMAGGVSIATGATEFIDDQDGIVTLATAQGATLEAPAITMNALHMDNSGTETKYYAADGTNFYEATVDIETGIVTVDLSTEQAIANLPPTATKVDPEEVLAVGGSTKQTVNLDNVDAILSTGTNTLHSLERDGKTEYFVKNTSDDNVESFYKATVAADGTVTLGGSVVMDQLGAIDAALQKVDDLRSDLGAIQNRFQSTIANLSNTVNNLSAARSRIEDADYAVEVSNMTRAQILQQAGTSVLAQANQVPQTVLSLLR